MVFFRHTVSELSAEDRAQLAAREVEVVDGTVTRLVIEGDRLTGVQLADGSVVARSALVVAPNFIANDEIIAELRAETERTATGTWIKTDYGGRTRVPGMWAVGNVADIARFVIQAAAAGARAGAAINPDLSTRTSHATDGCWQRN